MTMVRVAASRKERWCEQYYGPWAHDPVIKRGDLYATLTMSPGEARSEGVGDHWITVRLCIECALDGGTDRTVIKVIQALYLRGVLTDYPAPPRLVLAAGHAMGTKMRQEQQPST